MFHIKNDLLNVTLLDPIADRERFGVRYCTGGYIYQIAHHEKGDLLTGPTFPNSFNWFDGQGIPDAFNFAPLRSDDPNNPLALILGIGLCDLKARVIFEMCTWEIQHSTTSATFITQHLFEKWSAVVERTVRLEGAVVISETKVTNCCVPFHFIPICWFPHPFYPQPIGDDLMHVNILASMPHNDSYIMPTPNVIARKQFPTDLRGFYQALDHNATSALMIKQPHPLLGNVYAKCSYVPALFPIWGNKNTFSWEPFFERTLAPAQSVSWSIAYGFENT
jgi:hypothetical protein